MTTLTKFAHSCFTITIDGQSLVVDPGVYTDDFAMPQQVAVVLITHAHPDHYSPALIKRIIQAFPEAEIISVHDIIVDSTTISLPEGTLSVCHAIAAVPGDTLQIGPFTLEFFGGEHAVVSPDIPRLYNLAVLINNRIYYPGDSFALPQRPIDVLALPVAAPWLKFSEARSFLQAVAPRLAFPVHDAILSDAGKGLIDTLCTAAAAEAGVKYQRIETIELS